MNESTMNENNAVTLFKDDKHKKIAIFDKSNYVVLSQMNWDDNEKIDFVIGKDEIDNVCKTLQKMK
jgi:hypothetical protein